MAISVSIPKEITEYKEKIMFGMSLRQLICFVSAVVLSIGTYLICTMMFDLSMDTASYIIIVEAMPIMAVGFIQKDGMPFEKYFALFIRHKIGANKLYYGTELVIDFIPDRPNDEMTERKSKYAWIFENEKSAAAEKRLSRKERKAANSRREAQIFTVTEKSRKRKRKEALREIKAARQEYRTAKRRAKKAAKKRCRAQNNHTTD